MILAGMSQVSGRLLSPRSALVTMSEFVDTPPVMPFTTYFVMPCLCGDVECMRKPPVLVRW